MDPKKTLRTDGNIYIPIEKREGPESIVYFTRDLSAEGLEKMLAARKISGTPGPV